MQRFTGTQDYIADDALLADVNAAIVLEKPLLVRGEPGTGKTMLAESIAKALNKRLIRWHVKSTTKAQEGLFVPSFLLLKLCPNESPLLSNN